MYWLILGRDDSPKKPPSSLVFRNGQFMPEEEKDSVQSHTVYS